MNKFSHLFSLSTFLIYVSSKSRLLREILISRIVLHFKPFLNREIISQDCSNNYIFYNVCLLTFCNMRFCLNNRLFEERYDTASQICDHETKKKKIRRRRWRQERLEHSSPQGQNKIRRTEDSYRKFFFTLPRTFPSNGKLLLYSPHLLSYCWRAVARYRRKS